MRRKDPKKDIFPDLKYHLGDIRPDSPVEKKNRNWYIKMGFAGYNSPSNNAFGYKSRDTAIAAIRRWQNKG